VFPYVPSVPSILVPLVAVNGCQDVNTWDGWQSGGSVRRGEGTGNGEASPCR